MKHIKIFEDYNSSSYLGDGVGIMYNKDKGIMYIGSSDPKHVKDNYTINGIENDQEVLEIKEILKNVDPSKWRQALSDSGYEVSDGKEYFDVTLRNKKASGHGLF